MSFTMPWTSSSTQSKPSAGQGDVSLNDILPTTVLRVELVLLVVLCTDVMRESLTAVFDVKTSPDSPKTAPSSDFPLLDTGDAREHPPQGTALERTDTAYIHQRTLASPEIQSLKAGALAYFNKWRTSVLRRLGETLKVQPDAVKRAKAQYATVQETQAKARQSKYYLDMAEVDDMLSARGISDATRMSDPSSGSFHTKLNDLDTKTRALILHATFFILLSLENYPAHSRVLLTHILHSLDVPDDVLISAEVNLAQTLQRSTPDWTESQSQDQSPPSSTTSVNSRWKIGLATIAGATLIGITGGIAAPFLLGAAGAIMGGVGLGGLATLLGSTIANPVTVAALFGVLGGRTSGKAMEEYAKEVEDFEIAPVTTTLRDAEDEETGELVDNSRRSRPTEGEPSTAPLTHMRVAIGISGSLASERDIQRPWTAISAQNYSVFTLRYEPATLLKFGESLNTLFRSSAYTLAQAGALQLALSALSAALLPVSLLQLGKIVDNPFSIAMSRSDKAGLVLADALTTARVQGSRPVTLIGVSLGARVLYSCLQELARRRSFGIIENAIFIGSPIPSDQGPWIKMRSVVCGRLVNVFTTDDLVLGYLYRVRYAQVGVAGLEAITAAQSDATVVENFDVTGLVHGHGQYRLAVGQILRRIDLDGINQDRVEAEERALAHSDELERQVHAAAREEGQLDGIEDQGGRIVMVDTEDLHTSHATAAADGKTDNYEDEGR